MRKFIVFTVLLLSVFLVFQVQQLFATNIQVSNIVIVERNDADKYIIVQFDLSWDNSFRVDDGANTNWDAAWVFMKYKKTTDNNVQWGHASLHGSGHTIPGNFNGDLGNTDGTNKGIFVYPSVIFNGTASIEGMRLRWDYGDDALLPEDEVDIRVFGIEMVYVPQGNFYVGSGGTETSRFHAGGEATDVPFEISDAAFQIKDEPGNLYAQGDIGGGTDLASGFPTGYEPYYVMKHEITQQAYVDFLNTLDYAQQNARTETEPNTTGYLYDANRHKIKVETAGASGSSPAVYTTDNPWVACGYLSKEDMMSYLDWAALRPFTELEFEKAARGPSNPVPNEYAWGNTRVGSVTEVTDAGLATEAAVPSGYQRDITIDHNKVDADLTDFPILIKLDENNFDFSKCQPDGDDIRFYDASGTELAYQRERHDEPNKKAEYWVKVPNISSTQNTVISMEYGVEPDDGEDAVNVWNDGKHVSLWHLNEEGDGTAGEFADSLGNNHGQGTGTIPTRIDSLLGWGQEFPSDAGISVPDDVTLDIGDEITVSGWVNNQGITGANLSESTATDWNDNHNMSNITVDGDNLIVNDHTSDATRIAKPISLDSIKKVGSSNISWDAEFGYKVVAYNNDGVFAVPEGVSEVDVLVVAGGGGGGASPLGAGGGAGGVVYESGYSVTSGQTISINVGAGGTGATGPKTSPWQETDNSLRGENGENSSFGSIVAIGGGGGGRYNGLAGKDGGSGGGGGYQNAVGGNAQQPGSASGGYGNAGGDHSGSDYGNPGGGGAAEAGENSGNTGGNGGDGRYYGDIFGDSYGENGYFAGGGGGSLYNSTGAGSGGNGGGGDGGDTDSPAQDGIANTGGGGGGAERNYTGKAGNGGSGIVLIRYKNPQSVKVYTAVNDDPANPPAFNNIQVFNSDGTFNVPEGVSEVDVLIVAGGGGGGGSAGAGASGAGGGAGGLIYEENVPVTEDTYNIVVGSGGNSPGTNTDQQGSNGGNSSAFGLTAIGGGGGGSRDIGDGTGKDGGSGGGVGSQITGVQGTGLQPGSASGGFGSDGGDSGFGGNGSADNASGGGGGAGATGGAGQDNVKSGDGGIGRYYGDIFGDSYGDDGWFSGGGGGGNPGGTREPGAGGKGGGADGGSNDAANAMANTGGGGGGAGANGTPSDGGSGIVIVRWGHATNGGSIPGINHGDDLTGKYLWVKQVLNPNSNPDYSPTFKSLDLEVKGEAVIAGKGEDAYQLSVYDGNLKGYLNNQEVSSSLTNNSFQHVAITYDGSFQRIYVNGLLTGTSSLTGSINTNDTSFLMGYNLEGLLDEIRLSDTSRPQAWLKAEYHSGNGDLLNIGGEGTLNNANYGGVTITGIGGEGPLRVGYGATNSSSRTAAGASYWGIMNLSGNVWERTISVGNADGLSFTGKHGNGLLNGAGTFDVSNWLTTGFGFRGGQYHSGNQYLRISDRTHQNHNTDSRNHTWGGRGARTAP